MLDFVQLYNPNNLYQLEHFNLKNQENVRLR